MFPATKTYNVTDESQGHLRLLHRGHLPYFRLEHSRFRHPSLLVFAAFGRLPRPSTATPMPKVKILSKDRSRRSFAPLRLSEPPAMIREDDPGDASVRKKRISNPIRPTRSSKLSIEPLGLRRKFELWVDGVPTSTVDFDASVLGSAWSQLALASDRLSSFGNHEPVGCTNSIAVPLPLSLLTLRVPSIFGWFFISNLDFGSGCCRAGLPEQSRGRPRSGRAVWLERSEADR